MSANAPYVLLPVEFIHVFYKGDDYKRTGGTSTITKDEFIQWTYGLWTINGESATRIGHPAPYPRELVKRLLKLYTFKEDTILDPFLGSGTTLVEAYAQGRKGVGIEISSSYIEIAKRRLNDVISLQSLPFDQPLKQPPKSPQNAPRTLKTNPLDLPLPSK